MSDDADDSADSREAVKRAPVLVNSPPKGRQFPCIQCGARLDYNPGERNLKCPYCGHAQEISGESTQVIERDFDGYLARQGKETGKLVGHANEVHCEGCGAMVLLDDKVVTEKCPYCNTHLTNEPHAAEDMIQPESLLPFQIEKREAIASFQKWILSLWFAPTRLKVLALLGRLNGVYTPYWTYDSMTYSNYSGQRGDNYTVTVRNSKGESSTETRTRWTWVSGEIEHFFDDVLVCGSKSMPDKLILKLQSWQLGKLENFQSDFLSGFTTERYVVDLKEGFGIAKEVMDTKIRELVKRDIGGDHQRIDSLDTTHVGVTFKHVLLPIWVTSYRFNDKIFQVLVNGQTGEVAGDRPWSVWKIVRLVALILLGIGSIVMVVRGCNREGTTSNELRPMPKSLEQREVIPKPRTVMP